MIFDALAASSRSQTLTESTAFVGRKSELHALANLLASSRLITVAGPGGVGKTRLALRAAANAADCYQHGVVLVQLSGTRDPELLHHTVGRTLGLAQQGDGSQLDSIISYLCERKLLLALDSCEQMTDACALLALTLLREAPGVTILATSRQPLSLPDESILQLTPLLTGDAVDLFARRAASSVPGFEITAENRRDVIGVCRRLSGFPLGIELAAACLHTMDLGQLAGSLGDQSRRAPGGTIGWVYKMCTPAQQALWARLSVFAGPVTVAAAVDACAGGVLPADAIPGTLASLAAKTVLSQTGDRAPSYLMANALRDHGAARLAETGATEEVRLRFLQHYLRLAEKFDADPLTGQLTRYRALREQHDNIRAAICYGFEMPGQEGPAARLAGKLYWYWNISGLIREGLHWVPKALEQFPDPSTERAGALLLRGLATAVRSGRADDGVADCEAGLAMARNLGNGQLYARGYFYYCQALAATRRFNEASAAWQRAMSLLNAAGDTKTADILYMYLAQLGLMQGDLNQCLIASGEGQRRMPTASGERWCSSHLYVMAGIAQFLKGETERGSIALRKALTMREELGDLIGITYCLNALGYAAAGQARFRRAAWLQGVSAALWHRLGTIPFPGAPALGQAVGKAATRTREALGDEAYEELFCEGGRLALNEATRLAVADADELPADCQRNCR
ncbi:MAG TPA: NB-ARC domain-containing protein [Trebonia sp.]|jgi:predicted ATPase|nr:NB-ARC domain-containing protein [Trebonia sp.]